MSTPSDHLAFSQGEKALCFHGPLMYEAKIIKAEIFSLESTQTGLAGPHYLVHYKGWKTTWDEWVPEDRLKKFNEENLRQQKSLIEAQRERDATERERQRMATDKLDDNGNPTRGSRSGTTTGPKRSQKRSLRDVEGEGEYLKKAEIRLPIPEVLKVQLVDDWEAVTKNFQLVTLPRVPNVDTVLDDWLAHVKETEPEKSSITAEVISGLRLYFNKAVGNNLLYRFERGQFTEILEKLTAAGNEDAAPALSPIYGAEHLLRLFVNLPELLAHTAMDQDMANVLRDNLVALLDWLAENRSKYFSNAYENTSTGYQNNNKV